MKAMHLAAVLLVAAAAAAQNRASSCDAQVRINQIQVIGSHNSYHAGLLPGARAFLAKEKPDSLRGLDYAHQPLDKQFDGGILLHCRKLLQPGGLRDPCYDSTMSGVGCLFDPPAECQSCFLDEIE